MMSGRVILSSVILLGVILPLSRKVVLLCNNEYENTLSYMGCGFEGRNIQNCREKQESTDSLWHRADPESVYDELNIIYRGKASFFCIGGYGDALFYVSYDHENEYDQSDGEKREIADLFRYKTKELFIQCRHDICIRAYNKFHGLVKSLYTTRKITSLNRTSLLTNGNNRIFYVLRYQQQTAESIFSLFCPIQRRKLWRAQKVKQTGSSVLYYCRIDRARSRLILAHLLLKRN